MTAILLRAEKQAVYVCVSRPQNGMGHPFNDDRAYFWKFRWEIMEDVHRKCCEAYWYLTVTSWLFRHNISFSIFTAVRRSGCCLLLLLLPLHIAAIHLLVSSSGPYKMHGRMFRIFESALVSVWNGKSQWLANKAGARSCHTNNRV